MNELEEREQKNVDILLKKICHFWLVIDEKNKFKMTFQDYNDAEKYANENGYLLYGIVFNGKKGKLEFDVLAKLNDNKKLEIYDYELEEKRRIEKEAKNEKINNKN